MKMIQLKNYDGKEQKQEDKEAEEEEKEETLSWVEDANKEEVDGEKEENSKVTNKPFDNAILVIFDLDCFLRKNIYHD